MNAFLALRSEKLISVNWDLIKFAMKIKLSCIWFEWLGKDELGRVKKIEKFLKWISKHSGKWNEISLRWKQIGMFHFPVCFYAIFKIFLPFKTSETPSHSLPSHSNKFHLKSLMIINKSASYCRNDKAKNPDKFDKAFYVRNRRQQNLESKSLFTANDRKRTNIYIILLIFS